MSAPDLFQTEVARLAPDAAREHGFALAGGHALIAHGVISRPTEDVDLFTNADGAVHVAAQLVEQALVDAGFTVDVVPETSDLGDVFYGFGGDIVEFEIHKDNKATRLQLCRFDRSPSPVVMDIGPVLHIDDAIGTKVAAMPVAPSRATSSTSPLSRSTGSAPHSWSNSLYAPIPRSPMRSSATPCAVSTD
jgi:Nucleotidyl transferase AbiEii toxin, Type IV TA system